MPSAMPSQAASPPVPQASAQPYTDSRSTYIQQPVANAGASPPPNISVPSPPSIDVPAPPPMEIPAPPPISVSAPSAAAVAQRIDAPPPSDDRSKPGS